jgi:phasin family protein
MSTTRQFEVPTDVGKMTEKSMEQVPTDVRKMTEQSMEQVRTAIDSQLQFLKRAVPGNVMGGNELSNKVLNYAERNVHNAFAFAHKFVQVKDVQDLVKLQTEFIQSQMQAMTEQVKDLSETATKTVMDAVKGVGGPQGKGGASS